jgi:hypothetical protein
MYDSLRTVAKQNKYVTIFVLGSILSIAWYKLYYYIYPPKKTIFQETVEEMSTMKNMGDMDKMKEKMKQLHGILSKANKVKTPADLKRFAIRLSKLKDNNVAQRLFLMIPKNVTKDNFKDKFEQFKLNAKNSLYPK